MEIIKVKFLINHYEKEFSVQNNEYPISTKIGFIKDKISESETVGGCNIRVIYQGSPQPDDKTLRDLSPSSEGLILTVFITKPRESTTQTRQERSEVWTWSTSAWIAIIATLWNFSVMILYVCTFFFLHGLFSRLIRGARVPGRTTRN